MASQTLHRVIAVLLLVIAAVLMVRHGGSAISTSIAELVRIERAILTVRGFACRELGGTPLLELKPDRTPFKPIAPPQAGDGS